MPYRGRDSHYLELSLAMHSLLMACMCIHYSIGHLGPVSFMEAGALRVPVWLWSIMWAGSALALSCGVLQRRDTLCEYASLFTAGLWVMVFHAAVTADILLPLSLWLPPGFVAFSVVAWAYRARIVPKARAARAAKQANNGGLAARQ